MFSSSSSTCSRLLLDGRVLGDVETATGVAARTRGLLGRDGIDGVLLIPNARSVHTFGMAFDIDAAFCDSDGRVQRILTVKRNRVTRWVRGAAFVLEAEAGAFERWGVSAGDRLSVEPDVLDRGLS